LTEWIPLLRAAGHEAVHWLEVGDPRAPDKALMQWAIANRFAVFTHDLDFGTMLILSGADGPSDLQVRCLNVLSEAICTLVLSLLKTYGAVIKKGALVVADEESKMPHALPGCEQSRISYSLNCTQEVIGVSSLKHPHPELTPVLREVTTHFLP